MSGFPAFDICWILNQIFLDVVYILWCERSSYIYLLVPFVNEGQLGGTVELYGPVVLH